MQNHKLNYQGRTLFYRTIGEGPLVVLLHGFGEDGGVWKGQFDLFPNYRLLVPDLPGSGQSEAIEDMSIEGLAEAVKAMIEAPLSPREGGASPTLPKEGLSNTQPSPVGEAERNTRLSQSGPSQPGQSSLEEPAILIGHSMGGYITLAFAEKYPHLLRAFGLFHSTAFADSEEKKKTREKGIRFLEEHGAAEFLKTATPNLYAPASKEAHPEWITEHLAAVHNFLAPNLVSYYKAMIKRPDRSEVLRKSRVPVLFVLGRHDAAVPLEDGLKQCYLPQLSYIHILENAGHMGMIEERLNANQILSQFVNTIEITA